MLPKYVIVQALGGKPLKRVVMTSAAKGVLVVDPGLLGEIESGVSQAATAPWDRVFNFDERIFDDLLAQWRSAQQTSVATWAKLGHFQPMLDSVD